MTRYIYKIEITPQARIEIICALNAGIKNAKEFAEISTEKRGYWEDIAKNTQSAIDSIQNMQFLETIEK
jgi:hypothetical protein